MSQAINEAKALFLMPNGQVYPDNLICSGVLVASLGGQPCPYAQHGRIPDPVPLEVDDPTYNQDKGQPGDLCPPCAKQNLSHLGHWQGHGGETFPEALLPLRLFKCRQWLWLVVPGLYHDNPTQLVVGDEHVEIGPVDVAL